MLTKQGKRTKGCPKCHNFKLLEIDADYPHSSSSLQNSKEDTDNHVSHVHQDGNEIKSSGSSFQIKVVAKHSSLATWFTDPSEEMAKKLNSLKYNHYCLQMPKQSPKPNESSESIKMPF